MYTSNINIQHRSKQKVNLPKQETEGFVHRTSQYQPSSSAHGLSDPEKKFKSDKLLQLFMVTLPFNSFRNMPSRQLFHLKIFLVDLL